MSDNTCTIEGCGERIKARALCNRHYHRLTKYGDPLGVSDRERKADAQCSIDGCTVKSRRRGWCDRHYQKFKRHGDPTGGRDLMKYKTAAESFAARTEWDGDCLVWTGAKSGFGYGRITVSAYKVEAAHRWSWEQANGDIPEGMFIDHICHNPPCVRVDHLRVVTQKQNLEHRLGGEPGSKSPYRGVSWVSKSGQWKAAVSHYDQTVGLGYYDDPRDAALVALGARLALFTHNNVDREIAGLFSAEEP